VVSKLKRELKVADELALDQVIEGVFHPLEDTSTIEIRGEEVFVSHVRQGGAS
jgi:hypothetical protein